MPQYPYVVPRNADFTASVRDWGSSDAQAARERFDAAVLEWRGNRTWRGIAPLVDQVYGMIQFVRPAVYEWSFRKYELYVLSVFFPSLLATSWFLVCGIANFKSLENKTFDEALGNVIVPIYTIWFLLCATAYTVWTARFMAMIVSQPSAFSIGSLGDYIIFSMLFRHILFIHTAGLAGRSIPFRSLAIKWVNQDEEDFMFEGSSVVSVPKSVSVLEKTPLDLIEEVEEEEEVVVMVVIREKAQRVPPSEYIRQVESVRA